MKHLQKFVLFFVLLIGLGACQHQYPAGLVEADSLLWSNPNLALKRLKSMESCVATTNTSDKMYLYLLDQFAKERLMMEKNNVYYIQQIVSFFENSGEKDKLSKSYYLLARSLADLQDDFHALFYYQKALKTLEQTSDVKLRALLYHQIGYIMKNQEDYSQAKSFFEKSYQCDSVLSDTSAMAFALMDIAVLEKAANQTEKAYGKLYKALSYAKKTKNEDLARGVELQLANCYIYDSDNMDSVWYYLYPSLCNITKTNLPTVCFVASEYYWSRGQMERVKSYLLQVLDKGDIYCKQEACRRLITFYTYNDEVDASQLYLTKYIAYGDSIFDLKNKEHKKNGNVLYGYILQKDKLDDLHQEVKEKSFWGLVLLLCLGVIIFTLLFYYQMSVVKKLRFSNKLNKIKLAAFSKVEKEKQAKDEIIRQLNLEYFALSHKHLIEEDWQKLDAYVNQLYPGFREHLYSLHDLSKQEYHICLLLKIDIGTAQISIFTAHTMQSISMTKQRLYQKLTHEVGQARDLYEFLKTL